MLASTRRHGVAGFLGRNAPGERRGRSARRGPGSQARTRKFTAAVESAAAVQIQLGVAVKDFQRKWASAVAFAIASLIGSAVLVGYATAWSRRRELRQLEAQRDKRRDEMSTLQEQVDQAKRSSGRRPAR